MLIVYKTIDPKCAGKLKSVDTVVKTFTTFNLDTWFNKKAWQLYGTYKGHKKSNPSKEITVTIDTIGPTLFSSAWGTHLTNIPFDNYNPPRYLLRPDGTPQQARGYITYRGSISFASSKQTTMFDGYGTLKNDELNIVYSYHRDTFANGRPIYTSPLLQDEFIGTRIK